MKYDFDAVIDRRNTNSCKWDIAEHELPMWVADMDFRTAPEITAAITERAAHGIFGYSTVPDAWYAAYINWWDTRHGVKYQKSQLIFSTGVIPTISSCVRKLTSPAENVVILTPVYHVFYNCIRNNGRNVLECPMQFDGAEYHINWSLLEEQLADPQTTLMLLCNPHNPIGKIWDRETLMKIGDLAYDHGVIVLSDEIHCDLTDPGCSYVPFASVSEECAQNAVICVSPTKTFNLAGLQTSAAIVPNPKIRHKVWRALNTDECGEPNAFAVQAAVAAFEQGGAWLDELRQYLYENKQLVSSFLKAQIPQIRLVPSEATYLLWLDCSELHLNSKALADHIRKSTGLYLSNGVQFGNGEQFLRMNIACPKAMLTDGLNRLKKAVDLYNAGNN